MNNDMLDAMCDAIAYEVGTTKERVKDALPQAFAKRDRLIKRYGDNNGKRHTLSYLCSLIKEGVWFEGFMEGVKFTEEVLNWKE